MAVAVVTGGGSGIGRATAVELAKSGRYASVIIVGRRAALLEETKSLAEGCIEICVADIGSDEGMAAVVGTVADRAVSALVHNAAVMEPIAPVMELTRDDWRKIMNINLEAPVFLTQALLPNLKSAQGARVMLITSAAADAYIPGLDLYSISKGAQKFIFPGLRDQLVQWDIHVGSANPGLVDTSMPSSMIASSVPFVEYLKERVATGDIHPPEEVGRFFDYILSDKLAHADFSRKEGWDIDISEHPIEVHETSERKSGRVQVDKATATARVD